MSTVGLVLEGIYRDGTNSIATHAWTGGKLPLFLGSSGPFLASFLTLTLSDQAYKWFLQEFHDYEFLLQTPAFLKHVGLLLARRVKEPMGAVVGVGCPGS